MLVSETALSLFVIAKEAKVLVVGSGCCYTLGMKWPKEPLIFFFFFSPLTPFSSEA